LEKGMSAGPPCGISDLIADNLWPAVSTKW
jgi:hypothetical protein